MKSLIEKTRHFFLLKIKNDYYLSIPWKNETKPCCLKYSRPWLTAHAPLFERAFLLERLVKTFIKDTLKIQQPIWNRGCKLFVCARVITRVLLLPDDKNRICRSPHCHKPSPSSKLAFLGLDGMRSDLAQIWSASKSCPCHEMAQWRWICEGMDSLSFPQVGQQQ